MKRVLLFLLVVTTNYLHAQTTVQFSGSTDNSWLTPANWAGGTVPGASAIAVFNTNPVGNGSNNGCNINYTSGVTNNGSSNQTIGAIRVLSSRTIEMNIGNSSPSVDGTLTLAGVTVNSQSNIVVDNLMTGSNLNINNAIVGNSRVMKLALPAIAVFTGAANSVTEITTEVTTAGKVVVNGGTLRLNRTGGSTFPSNTNVEVSNGTLYIGRNQTINNLDLAPGTTLYIEANTSLTVTGTFTHRGATVTMGGGSSQFIYGPDATLEYAGSSAQSVTSNEWPAAGGPKNIIINNTAGVAMTAARTISGTVTVNGTLSMGAFQLTAPVVTVANGAVLKVGSTSTTDAIEGNFGASASVTFASGSTIEFNGTAVQSIAARTFSNNLIINNNSGVTIKGNVVVAGNLSLTAGSFSTGIHTLTLSGPVLRTAGSINGTSGTIVLNGSTTQAISASVFGTAINQLTINNTAGVTTAGSLTVGTSLNLTAGTFTIGSNTLTINGSVNRTAGVINASSGAVVFNGAAAQSVAAAAFTGPITNVTVNNAAGVTTAANLTITNSLTLTAGSLSLGTSTLTLQGNISRSGGTINASSGTLVFAGTNAQSIPSGAINGALNNVIIENFAGVSTASNQTINGTLTLTGGAFSPGSTTLTLNGNVAVVAGSINAASTSIVYNGTAGQIIDAGAFTAAINNLTVNNAAGVNTSADAVITGTLALTAGTYNIGTSTHTITGSITTAGGFINAASGTLVFNGSVAQVIPAGSINTTIRNLTVNNASGLTINANHTISAALNLQAGSLSLNDRTLTLSGTVTGAGNLRGSALSGIAVASAGAAGTLNFDQTTDGTSNALASLAVYSGSAVLGTKLNLFTLLNVTGGSLDLAAKNVVLKSLSTNTARVAAVTGTITGATNVTVERWFPNSGRRYRLVTPGVTTSTSIRANWMEGAINTSFCLTCNVNPKPGYGTHITGTGGNANGFDVTTTNNASLYTFNPATGGWVAVTSTAGTLNASTPFLIFIRGDRSVDMTAPGSVPVLLPGSGTTLRATGTLPVGNRTVTNMAAAGKVTLVSNPYPSPISWTTILANNNANFENYYTYWEPKIGQRGAYVTVTSAGLNNNVNSTANEQIQSGQGFMVTTKAGITSPSLTIREQDKSGTSNINVFRAPTGNIEKFYISLNFTESNGQKFNADGVLAAYSPGLKNTLDANDAVQIGSWDEDVAIIRSGKLLSIETRSSLSENDTLQLAIARLKTGQRYEWQFTPKEMTGSVTGAFLVDRFLNKRTAVSLTDTTFVSFTVTTDPASVASNRFLVVFKPELNTLPVTFTSVKASQSGTGGKVVVDWHTSHESGIVAYDVERSANGREFSKIGSANAKNGSSNVYSFVDGMPLSGNNYYHIKSLDQNGSVKYSNMVLVKLGGGGERFAIYPNPMQGNNMSLRFGNLPKGVYTLQIWNSAGSQVFSSRLEWSGGNGTQAVSLPETLSAGAYQVNLQGAGINNSMLLLKE